MSIKIFLLDEPTNTCRDFLHPRGTRSADELFLDGAPEPHEVTTHSEYSRLYIPSRHHEQNPFDDRKSSVTFH